MRIKLLTVLLIFVCLQAFAQQDQWLFIGTYTGTGSKGIYVYRFHPSTNSFDSVGSIFCENPSYLAVSGDGNYLYAVTENGVDKPGAVSAFSFDQQKGQLHLLNEQASGGDHPCYVSVSKKQDWVAVANYSGGSLSMLKVNSDGSLQPKAQIVQRHGSSTLENRQAGPHVHSAMFSRQEKYLLTCDLGTDEVTAYHFHRNRKMPLDTVSIVQMLMKRGDGPRHLAYHPSKPWLYILEEMSGNISVRHFSRKNTKLIQEIASDTLSPSPDKGSADIHFSPDGKFLYSSNRGIANNIAIYSVNQKNGRLSIVGYQSTVGEKPRNFVIDATGKFLLVANQKSNNVVLFNRNETTGLLSFENHSINIPAPVCLKMIPVR